MERAGPVGIGVVAPYDFALDRELWRWLPEDAVLHLTRTPHLPLEVGIDQAAALGEVDVVAAAARDLATPEPAVVAYACTSASFVHGRAGERALVDAMLASGIPQAVTTSGSLLEALAELGLLDGGRVAVATPYDDAVGGRLDAFLAEGGARVTGIANLGLTARIWTLTDDAILDLVRAAAAHACDAIFVSCTNLVTYDLVAPLEAELGVPVLTANQVTMWAALRRAGLAAVGPGRLLNPLPGRAA